ncbi:conserved hypothetical protein [Mycoplasma haemofelis str. Langford 1]|uniref:YneF family protein n=1 Tax=Mycoplasma haemofelis (strain Langford 1) TaxID=941640 RepID=E8ZKF6_MYCHL|nr:YneF family protein [Mycoplasma haemofelis]CBY92122.1 conserved hypothetical protein [Mycoplasma haemofelis str. Langford 1]
MSYIAIFFLTVIAFLLGAAVGWIFAVKYCKKQMIEHPPINEQQIRELYRQAGRTLSEKQVLQIMNNLKRQQS